MAKRDIGQEILDGLKAIKQGKGKRTTVLLSDVTAIRENMKMSQSVFAAMLSVSAPCRTGNRAGASLPSRH